ncbi:ornithine cyclodeaminase family protein [Alicyclobacillus sp. ALC3]|uniref:ornithine cyclodeaminase family protein n=1 Tax=Alicyclobacillus sp. ALC3 TaxID=2796143 RepID=UPI0023791E6D|nr:ornithine cyclodeaminase family protein [Alicyclobacillus sp. ALC3]WDL97648.1 ornithine cyclodeaminase family protein [Alicyclobacillus sp. ALC3]
MLVLSREEVERAIAMTEAIESVRTALVEFSAHRTQTPIRSHLSVGQAAGTALVMPSLVPNSEALGLKFVSVFPRNQAIGKKTTNGVLVLADINTGEPMALMDATYITVLRTGAVVGLATQYLAQRDAKVLGVVGTGEQALGIVSAIREVRQLDEIRLFNRTEEKAHRFAEAVRQDDPVNCPSLRVVATSQKAVEGADIIVTATNSTTPVFASECVRPGCHINAVGSFRQDMQELPTELFERGPHVFVESVEAALQETGDLIVPTQLGLVTAEQVHELGREVQTLEPIRQPADDADITIFKSVGLAAMDMVVAKTVYDRAIGLKLGTHVPV